MLRGYLVSKAHKNKIPTHLQTVVGFPTLGVYHVSNLLGMTSIPHI